MSDEEILKLWDKCWDEGENNLPEEVILKFARAIQERHGIK